MSTRPRPSFGRLTALLHEQKRQGSNSIGNIGVESQRLPFLPKLPMIPAISTILSSANDNFKNSGNSVESCHSDMMDVIDPKSGLKNSQQLLHSMPLMPSMPTSPTIPMISSDSAHINSNSNSNNADKSLPIGLMANSAIKNDFMTQDDHLCASILNFFEMQEKLDVYDSQILAFLKEKNNKLLECAAEMMEKMKQIDEEHFGEFEESVSGGSAANMETVQSGLNMNFRNNNINNNINNNSALDGSNALNFAKIVKKELPELSQLSEMVSMQMKQMDRNSNQSVAMTPGSLRPSVRPNDHDTASMTSSVQASTRSGASGPKTSDLLDVVDYNCVRPVLPLLAHTLPPTLQQVLIGLNVINNNNNRGGNIESSLAGADWAGQGCVPSFGVSNKHGAGTGTRDIINQNFAIGMNGINGINEMNLDRMNAMDDMAAIPAIPAMPAMPVLECVADAVDSEAQNVDSDEREHLCKICSKGLNSRHELENHLKLHCNERPFQCHHCRKKFRLEKELKAHLSKSKKCQYRSE